ncbi:hypothetical protein [Acetobacterium carbinolicum]|uniref:hypothetical protein n=1 Tax=Acetobacterium carbinolicum TaxID=52690 RepID=UPI003BF4F4A4
MKDDSILKNIFGDTSASREFHKMILNDINNNKFQYCYLSIESFKKVSIKEGMGWTNQYMSTEILQRIYFATITGYLRQYRWIEGIYNGIETSNYLVFAASLRGFLESVTDYYDALYNIPLNLAEQYELVNKALRGEITDYIINYKELENILLHFQEASKNSLKTDPLYNPKTAKAYMESKHLKPLNLYKCYCELCEITHPAKDSLELFIDENNFLYSFNNNKDKDLIEEFMNRHSEKFSELHMRFENLCIINLKLLNLFKIDKFCTVSVESIDTDGIILWTKIKKYVNKFQ